ncbi:HAMP domain-containing sensor histidine kinase [Agromyces sp. Marseille-P2726]|uniref:HAMP domain-containing sensor histidine kinase n=1 Tax=Agromyces sp. Marseille-P2726 TaxID=2709132 RepID=UPI0015712656|nr:HAMP domain-containing sensor histidine kinase [Agromyces sp. Marseille-P2726]
MAQTEATQAPRRASFPVRARIVGIVVIVAAIGVFLAGAFAHVVQRERILANIDDRLTTTVENARIVVTEGQWTGLEPALRAVVQQINPDRNEGTLGIIDGRAALVPGVNVDVPLDAYPSLVPRVVDETAGGNVVMGTFVSGDDALRYIATPVRLANDPQQGIFVAAYDVRGSLADLDAAARTFAISAAVTVAAAAVVGWLVSGRLLGPLRRLRETAARITATASSERVDVHGNDDVSQLARTFNEMLDRLDGALEGQRRLLDDVGHELKTPITIVRGHLELLDPSSPADVEETRGLAIEELDRMADLVADISSALEAGSTRNLVLEPVDVGALTRAVIAKAQAIDGARVTEGPVAEGTATLDAARVTQAILQLAANAATHGGGDITIGSRIVEKGDGPSTVAFAVADRGPGIPEEAQAAVFERFGRVDVGRGVKGSGLGLSIVQAIARTHGGRVDLVSTPGFGSTFTLVLPLHPPGDSA